MSEHQTEHILDTLTDEERAAAAAFVREQRQAAARRQQGEALVREYIQRRDEAGARKPSPLDRNAAPRLGGRYAL